MPSGIEVHDPAGAKRLAPAKINLALHVVGQRADGHHLLESIVAFADIGDRVEVRRAEIDDFTVSGRFSGGLPTDGGNLVIRARDLLRTILENSGHDAGPVHLYLEKNLPIASGIGGGSADAAAALKGLMSVWGAELPPERLLELALQLGADLPMCLTGTPLIAHGIGEAIVTLDSFPSLPLVLVNPLVALSTPVVFRALANKANPALDLPADPSRVSDWPAALAAMRNDLEPPARGLEGSIEIACNALMRHGAGISRMSGSGATCFGVFPSDKDAIEAAEALSRIFPDWYVAACRTMASGESDGRN